jgi:hypothetical protein
MISGSIMADGDRRLLDIIEGELGARVVIEDHCAGVRPFYHRFPKRAIRMRRWPTVIWIRHPARV